MQYIELRRHTLRDGDNPHISQEGLDLARRIGVGLGPYAKVISSPSERCIETAIAMGFAVEDVYEPVQDTMSKKRVKRLAALLPPDTPFATRSQVMQEHKSARKYCRASVAMGQTRPQNPAGADSPRHHPRRLYRRLGRCLPPRRPPRQVG